MTNNTTATTTLLNLIDNLIDQPFAWPGGYSRQAVLADGEIICNNCLKTEKDQIVESTTDNCADGWALAGEMIHWEGDAIICCNCNKEIESEYGTTE